MSDQGNKRRAAQSTTALERALRAELDELRDRLGRMEAIIEEMRSKRDRFWPT